MYQSTSVMRCNLCRFYANLCIICVHSLNAYIYKLCVRREVLYVSVHYMLWFINDSYRETAGSRVNFSCLFYKLCTVHLWFGRVVVTFALVCSVAVATTCCATCCSSFCIGLSVSLLCVCSARIDYLTKLADLKVIKKGSWRCVVVFGWLSWHSMSRSCRGSIQWYHH